MDSGLPILNCLLQHTLRNFCNTSTSSDSSNWVYSIFWRILPRNYPPPKWEHGGSVLDRVKGSKKNWILVWEDGFCDFFACQGKEGGFGADIFFKLSHEVYNYGEGLIGKVAADNSYKWVFQDTSNESDPNFIFSRNVAALDHQPKAWEAHFSSGIQTIALISVREGIIQLGSFDKVAEDFNMVTNIQRKFSYLQSIPGMYAVQRPSSSSSSSSISSSISTMQIQYPLTLKPNNYNEKTFGVDEKRQLVGSKRLYCDRRPLLDDLSLNSKSIISGPLSSSLLWSIPFPPLFPWTPSYPCTTTTKPPSKYLPPFSLENAHMFNARGISADNTAGFISAHVNEKVVATCKMEAVPHEDTVGKVKGNAEMESEVAEMGAAESTAFDLH